MNKKKCPQCKNLISVEAPTCLYCGRPNKFVTKNYVKKKWENEYKKNNKININKKIVNKYVIIFIFIVLIVILNL